MRAAQITAYGGPGVLQAVSDAPKPSAGPGEVLVAVAAAGVNPFDWKVREGYMKQMIRLSFPATLGGDVAGTVAAVGDDVSGFGVGDKVYGHANAGGGKGSFAEFTPVKAGSLAAMPTSLDDITAAAAPLAGVSAYQALVEHAHIQAGHKVLIHGGAGGIGSLAIQIAKHLGAHVATTVGSSDLDFAQQLGADEVIDYQHQAFETMLKDYDVVFDTVGGDTFKKSFAVLKPTGSLVSMVGKANYTPSDAARSITLVSQFTKVTTEKLMKLSELIDTGAVNIYVDKVFPLAKAGDALAYLQKGGHRGKVVIQVA